MNRPVDDLLDTPVQALSPATPIAGWGSTCGPARCIGVLNAGSGRAADLCSVLQESRTPAITGGFGLRRALATDQQRDHSGYHRQCSGRDRHRIVADRLLCLTCLSGRYRPDVRRARGRLRLGGRHGLTHP